MKFTIQLSGIASELARKEKLNIEIINTDKLDDTIINSIPGLEEYYFFISINGKKTENYSSVTAEDDILVFSPIAGG
jgi:hypothetical protein